MLDRSRKSRGKTEELNDFTEFSCKLAQRNEEAKSKRGNYWNKV